VKRAIDSTIIREPQDSSSRGCFVAGGTDFGGRNGGFSRPRPKWNCIELDGII
jgi:hypothetical protein